MVVQKLWLENIIYPASYEVMRVLPFFAVSFRRVLVTCHTYIDVLESTRIE